MKRLITILYMLLSGMLLNAREVSPERPSIPEYSVSVLDFGAVPDGITLNTDAFSKAVAAVGKKGGGHIVVPAGIYLSGSIVLKDCMDLHLEEGSVLLLSPDKKDSWDGKGVKPFITASKRHDVSISGEGIIDGNGAWWRAVKRNKVSDTE
ncbi:MAG: glycoside hydrolase family 28 protein, partial [Bacteroidales bacterium]|nr:glycoside hydrolase family 28 protein [Bacteroidales bacterium]